MSRSVFFGLVFLAVTLFAGCVKPYVKAQRQYWGGNSEMAASILQPELDKAVQSNSIEKNLFMWDMGIYCLSSGKYDCAADCFMKSVSDYQDIHGAGKTAKAIFTSAASQKYVGDPVEVSVAYLFLGLTFYLKEDYNNALIALRRSIEEDLCEDAGCEGDMATTNFILGECYARVGEIDNAAVAYRRAIQFNPDFIPAYACLYWALRQQGETGETEAAIEQMQSRVDPAYFEAVKEHGGHGEPPPLSWTPQLARYCAWREPWESGSEGSSPSSSRPTRSNWFGSEGGASAKWRPIWT